MTVEDGRRRTLIVDDDPSLLDALESAFREAGEDTVACASFPDARRALQTGQFNALITDVRLGEFNGLQLAFMARETFPEVVVIVFSAFDDPVLRVEAEHLEAIYLVKPVSSSTLLELVRR
jgi:DNA-binding NtrC family response regulator